MDRWHAEGLSLSVSESGVDGFHHRLVAGFQHVSIETYAGYASSCSGVEEGDAPRTGDGDVHGWSRTGFNANGVDGAERHAVGGGCRRSSCGGGRVAPGAVASKDPRCVSAVARDAGSSRCWSLASVCFLSLPFSTLAGSVP